MRIAYLDCFSGISGDMFLGALIDAGVPPAIFEQAVAALNLGAKLEIARVNRSGISATKVDVVVDGQKDQPREAHIAQSGPHDHSHHEHVHDHHHADNRYAHGRGLTEIREIIEHAVGLSESAKKTAVSIFEKLGAAESKIHDVPIEKVHFHEVGAVDALVDIVCAAVGAEALGVDEFIAAPQKGDQQTAADGASAAGPSNARMELFRFPLQQRSNCSKALRFTPQDLRPNS